MTDPRVEVPQAPPSILEDLLARSKSFIEDAITDRIKASFERFFESTMQRVVACLIAAVLFGAAAVFALVAGLEGLKQAGAPVWAAYLSVALVGALGGGLLIRKPSDPPRR